MRVLKLVAHRAALPGEPIICDLVIINEHDEITSPIRVRTTIQYERFMLMSREEVEKYCYDMAEGILKYALRPWTTQYEIDPPSSWCQDFLDSL